MPAAPFAFRPVDPRSSDGQAILERFFADIIGRYWSRPATSAEIERVMTEEPSDDLRGEKGFLLIVQHGAGAIGCGGVRIITPRVGELTRIFIDPSARQRGGGRALIGELERLSVRRGLRILRLTVRSDLTEARRLYRDLGYRPVDPFSTSPYADHHLAKTLRTVTAPWSARRPPDS